MAVNGHPAEALRMATAIEKCRWPENSRHTLYFAATGRRIIPGGRSFTSRDWAPQSFAFAVLYPFCPSAASCADMLVQFRDSGEPVFYDDERWRADPRVDEQAGPSVTEDWRLDEMLSQVAA